jgi:SOS-response transcriptional repressor LexA
MSVDFRGLQDRLRQRLLAEIAAGELTGLELARQTGFRQAHISNFLNRKRGLSLEGMDAILVARKLSLADLLPAVVPRTTTRHTIHAASADDGYIPLVDGKNCHASEVPYSQAKHTLQVMSARLQKLATHMSPSRAQWQRFVAFRVGVEDAAAMAPRLIQGAIAVIDRHCHQVDGSRSMYLVQHEKTVLLRCVERTGQDFVLRPENPACPLLRLRGDSRDALAAIIGRVCLVVAEV